MEFCFISDLTISSINVPRLITLYLQALFSSFVKRV